MTEREQAIAVVADYIVEFAAGQPDRWPWSLVLRAASIGHNGFGGFAMHLKQRYRSDLRHALYAGLDDIGRDLLEAAGFRPIHGAERPLGAPYRARRPPHGWRNDRLGDFFPAGRSE